MKAGHRIGPADAPVNVIVFSDYECPFSRELAERLRRLRAEMPSQVAVLYRNYPLASHPYAAEAAQAAVCAGKAGRFEQYHDLLTTATSDSFSRRPWAALAIRSGIQDTTANIAYMVTQRTREIGIRLALGADPRSALMLIARRGVRLAAGGVGIGVVAAFALRRILASLLSGTGIMNPWVLAGTSSLVLAVALVATWLPARRATRVDPVLSMRTE